MQADVTYHVQIFVSGRWDNYGFSKNNAEEAIEYCTDVKAKVPQMKFRVVKKTVTLEEIEYAQD